MRRASRDYTKYLRGSEEMGSGGSGAQHEGPLHAPPPPAPPAPHQPAAAASRSMFVAFLGLGLGQVVCSVALFLYFRAQVSAGLPGGPPTSSLPRLWETESGRRLGSPNLAYAGGESDSKEGASDSGTAPRGARRACLHCPLPPLPRSGRRLGSCYV